MEIKVNAIKFDASEKLVEFIEKKVGKLEKLCDEITEVEVRLKVEKPATNGNKEADISVFLPKETLYAEKVCDTFEEAVTQNLLALEKQIVKYKEKLRSK
ncbi:MAG: ribosome-associated translation inhibitor RaiA [Bacteroidaceae bacterium]|nr:ribosome-associated translation inhibitor RaiA [Bacteroidaceae bacterium]